MGGRRLEKYLFNAKQQLCCNASEYYKNNYITYDYTDEQIDRNKDYFERCMKSGLSDYKALLFFGDYLNGDYDI